MKIRTLTRLCSGLLIIFTIAIGAVVSFASRQTERIAAQGTQAEKVIIGTFELSQLTLQYVERFEERPLAQWYLQHDALDRALSSPAFENRPVLSRTLAEERSIDKLLKALHSDFEDIRGSFDALVQRSGAAASDRSLANQLSGDLSVKTQRMILDAGSLADLSARARATARLRTDRLIFCLLALLVIIANAVFLLVYRRIIGALANLQKGARIVGDGDLTHRVGNARKDEIGELARAFDAMTSKLKTSYDTLEEQVEERTRELHMMGRRNEIMLASIGDGIIAIDRLWNITLWNPATARLTGWSADDAVGKPFRERVRFIREHDRKENLAFIEDAMLLGETQAMSNSTLLVTRDGREIPVGDSAAPIFDDDGKVSGVIIVFRDVTREKDAVMLRSDFAYASHQLRTPVNKAMWDLEDVMGDAKDPEILEKLQIAYHAIRDVQKLSSRLIDVSQIDQKQIVPVHEELKISAVIKEVVAALKDAADGRDIRLVVKPYAEDFAIDTDPKLLRTALQEVVDNAVRYGVAGGAVEIGVRAEKLDLVFQVADSGIGIPDEQKPLIFTKFFRGQNVPVDAHGAGLGLFIAREYARLIGGKIWFESRLGSGTSFTISIPRVRGMKE